MRSNPDVAVVYARIHLCNIVIEVDLHSGPNLIYIISEILHAVIVTVYHRNITFGG